MKYSFVVFPIIVGLSCLGANSRELESPTSTDTSEKMTPEDRELLKYCQKVQEISDRQKKTDVKVDMMLAHFEDLNIRKTPVALDASKREELRSGWEDIETKKRAAMEVLQEVEDSGALPSGIVHSKE